MAVEEISLAELRRRTSAKWRTYPPDVLPLPVAELDFRVAGPVAEALRAAVGRCDLGDANPSSGLPQALANLAAHRWGWQVDPVKVTLTPEVGVTVVESLACCPTGRPGGDHPTGLRLVRPLAGRGRLPTAGVPLAATGDGWALDLDAMPPRPRTGPASTCWAHRTTRPAPSTGATTRAAGGAGRPLRRGRAGRPDPRAAGAARPSPPPVGVGVAGGGRAWDRRHLGQQGVEPRRAQGRGDRHRRPGHPAAGPAAAGGAAVAGRAPGRARQHRQGPGGAQLRAELRPPRYRPCPAEPGHQPAAPGRNLDWMASAIGR
jgi:hypothetical protein